MKRFSPLLLLTVCVFQFGQSKKAHDTRWSVECSLHFYRRDDQINTVYEK